MNIDSWSRSAYFVNAYRLNSWAQHLNGCLTSMEWTTSGLDLNPPVTETGKESMSRELSQSLHVDVSTWERRGIDWTVNWMLKPWSGGSRPVHLSWSRSRHSPWTMRSSAHIGSWKRWVRFVFNNYVYYWSVMFYTSWGSACNGTDSGHLPQIWAWGSVFPQKYIHADLFHLI